jgi:hypothetical protein
MPFAESIIGRSRDESLNETFFRSLPHARAGGVPITTPNPTHILHDLWKLDVRSGK